jgi:hypothetical protein
MWICSQHGFYSIVSKASDEYHVRARLKRDLENLLDLVGQNFEAPFSWAPGVLPKIHRSRNADYRWRIVVTHRDVMEIMMCLASEITYSNFKERIHRLPDQDEKSSAYGQLWANLYQLQED